MPMSWREAIQKVLEEEGRPMRPRDISELVLSRGYYKTDGATPDATVGAQITASIKHDGVASPFVKVARGVYGLRSAGTEAVAPNPTGTRKVKERVRSGKRQLSLPPDADSSESDESVIRCLGMYWQRDLVVWRREPRLFGKQQAESKPVDFGGQRGIYILYDHHTVVYVGRSVDRPLGKRLFEHTVDRLASRWNRFSWFGLLDVTDRGELVEVSPKVTMPSLIGALEALLIEALEPPQNRRRGDDLSVVEYIQGDDPERRERDLRNTLRAIEQKLREQS